MHDKLVSGEASRETNLQPLLLNEHKKILRS